jgi:hypothetical protein
LPTVTLLTADVESVAKTTSAALTINVLSTKAGAADQLQHSIALAAYAGVSSPDETAKSLFDVGLLFDLDRGDGNLSRLPLSELGPQVSISGSLDGYGRSMSISRAGVGQSPILYGALRSPLHIKATGCIGTPGNIQQLPVFDGYFLRPSFDSFPASARIDCQDVSLKYSSIKLDYNLDPGSFKTRREVLIEILNKVGIPFGLLDMGPNDGGLLFKPISVGGDRPVLDFLRDFLSPIGRRFYFRPDGKMEVRRFDLNQPVQRTLRAADIGGLSITPPATNDPNSTSVSGTLFYWVDASGFRTVVRQFPLDFGSSDPSTTIKAATSKQDHTTGNITPITPPSGLPQPGGYVKITSVFSGNTLVMQRIESFAYYSARACARQQAATTGVIDYNHSFDVYFYPDGSCRMDHVERLQKVSDQLLVRTFLPDGKLLTERKDLMRFVPIEMPIATIDAAAVETPVFGFITDDGKSWWAGREIFEESIGDTSYEARARLSTGTESTFTTYLPDPNTGQLFQTQTASYIIGTNFYAIVNKPVATVINPSNYAVFGPLASKRYGVIQASEGSGLNGYLFCGQSSSVVNATVDETHYKQTVTLNSLKPSIEFDRMHPPSVTPGVTIIAGAIPIVEKITATQIPGPTTQVVSDDVRSALVGAGIPEYIQNDFCEDPSEFRTVCIERIRELSAMQVETRIPIDWSIKEGDVVKVNIPEITGTAIPLLVWGVQHNFNGATVGDTSLSCRFWPAEVTTN